MKKIDLNDILPIGLFASKKWLLGRGLSTHSIDNCLKSSQLESYGRGVYKRSGLPLDWQGALSSFAMMHKEAVYLGGLSALENQGLGHYVQAKPKYFVYSSLPEPSWFKRLLPEESLVWVSTNRLWTEKSEDLELKNIKWREDVTGYWLASIEQAYLELLFFVPNQFDFEFADQIMEGLVSLSPVKLKKLLLSCKNVKTKRLFFWYAKRHQHSWIKYLNQKDFDLGSGNRVIAKDGALDKDLFITVPRGMHG